MDAALPPRSTSLVLCTRNRSEGALATVRSMMEAGGADEIIVVDQSDDLATKDLLSTAIPPGCVPVRVVRDDRRGIASARNLGMRTARGDVVLFTDDDCFAIAGWVEGFRAVLDPDPRIALAFGAVLPVEYDRSLGFVPAYRPPARFVANGLSQKCRIEGMGACMAVRTAAWRELGGFDETLGTGAALRAAEESDLVVRALASGWRVAETPDAAVRHDGFRTWAQGRDLIEGYMTGLGASNTKMLRLAGWRGVRPVVQLGWRWLMGSPVVDLNQRPPRMERLAAFLRGAREGWRLPIDRETGRFVSR